MKQFYCLFDFNTRAECNTNKYTYIGLYDNDIVNVNDLCNLYDLQQNHKFFLCLYNEDLIITLFKRHVTMG